MRREVELGVTRLIALPSSRPVHVRKISLRDAIEIHLSDKRRDKIRWKRGVVFVNVERNVRTDRIAGDAYSGGGYLSLDLVHRREPICRVDFHIFGGRLHLDIRYVRISIVPTVRDVPSWVVQLPAEVIGT